MILLLPGFLYGVGNLLLKVLGRRREFGESVALSLVLWSILGWFSFGHFREVVVVLSAVGTLWTLYVLLVERPKPSVPVVLFFVASALRYALTLPSISIYPYQKDFIMHVYTTATVLHYNGYGPEYYPFGVPGFGAFNLGFHFVSAGFSYLLGIHPMNSTLVAVYTFWGILFWALYRWVGNPWIALMSIFIFPYPLSFLRWGGFPTVASIALGLLAFRERPTKALPYWIGAFSLHFIPASIPFLVYVFLRFRRLKDVLPYTLFLLLLPQYYLILKGASHMSPYEMAIVDKFVVANFPKASVVVLLLLLLALLGYRMRSRCEVPLWGILLSIFAGVVSFLFAYLHVPFNAPKSLYMARMVLLILPPAAYGVIYLWRKLGILTLALPVVVSSYVASLHYVVGLDPDDWRVIESIPPHRQWFLTSYRSEGAYLPALGSPSWMSHYIVSQVDEFREAAEEKGFRYVVCDREDPVGPVPYYREVCAKGRTHPDVEGILAEGGGLVVYRLRRVVHPSLRR